MSLTRIRLRKHNNVAANNEYVTLDWRNLNNDFRTNSTIVTYVRWEFHCGFLFLWLSFGFSIREAIAEQKESPVQSTNHGASFAFLKMGRLNQH